MISRLLNSQIILWLFFVLVIVSASPHHHRQFTISMMPTLNEDRRHENSSHLERTAETFPSGGIQHFLKRLENLIREFVLLQQRRDFFCFPTLCAIHLTEGSRDGSLLILHSDAASGPQHAAF